MESTDVAADVMLRLQVIQSLRTDSLSTISPGSDGDTYAAAAKKALRSLQANHPQLFEATPHA